MDYLKTIKIKEGATIAGLDLRMRPAMIAAAKVYNRYGFALTITCGLDGEHSAGSMHYYGLAIDLRTRFFVGIIEPKVVADKIQEILGSSFDVILHSTHIHIEYNLM
jgi:hypothetical protein